MAAFSLIGIKALEATHTAMRMALNEDFKGYFKAVSLYKDYVSEELKIAVKNDTMHYIKKMEITENYIYKVNGAKFNKGDIKEKQVKKDLKKITTLY